MTFPSASPGTPPLELWGGVECTIARVGDDYRDQLEETGHAGRREDVDRIASLGVTRVRYPILWERIAPDRPDRCDFAWTDDRLAMLRERGIAVAAGLVHHGSGPRYTSLIDPGFPAKLADFAARVADRYPWIDLWTPVNEPLTTARFAGLYGHWYPHGRDTGTMLRALFNECKATAAAMTAIRAVNPAAQLLQTEDLGKSFSTPPLRYQADHENERRWLSFDLLAGRVDPEHMFWSWLRDAGVSEAELEGLLDGSGKPDVLGINHYLTSERFLDHRLTLYPGEPGGNGRDSYHDVEAVRVEQLDRHTGIGPRLQEAWRRYGLPIAITEVHHGCTRDEQLRWFVAVWKAAEAQRRLGVDLRGVTLWSLFGNVDWRSLLTRREGLYDVGVFDARDGVPRPTVIAAAARAFASGEDFDHPVLDMPGWWRRPQRLYPWHGGCKTLEGDGRSLLIVADNEPLGPAFADIAEHRGLPFCIVAPAGIEEALAGRQIWAVIDAAGIAGRSEALAASGLPLVTFGSDAGDQALTIRSGPLFSASDDRNFAWQALASLARGESVRASRTAFVSPTFVPDLCHAVLDLLIDGETGVWHLANRGRLSWHDFARRLAEAKGHDLSLILATEDEPGNPDATPEGRLLPLRSLDEAIASFLWDVADRPELRSEMEVAAE